MRAFLAQIKAKLRQAAYRLITVWLEVRALPGPPAFAREASEGCHAETQRAKAGMCGFEGAALAGALSPDQDFFLFFLFSHWKKPPFLAAASCLGPFLRMTVFLTP